VAIELMQLQHAFAILLPPNNPCATLHILRCEIVALRPPKPLQSGGGGGGGGAPHNGPQESAGKRAEKRSQNRFQMCVLFGVVHP